MVILGTLCYLRRDGRTLMMHRNRKLGDMHAGKWNGLGGKLEAGESPDECVVREVGEESGLAIERPVLKAVLTFPQFRPGEDWTVFLYLATEFAGVLSDCPEGDLAWIEDARLPELALWEGDRIFMPLLDRPGFFTGKFSYRDGRLIDHWIRQHCPAR